MSFKKIISSTLNQIDSNNNISSTSTTATNTTRIIKPTTSDWLTKKSSSTSKLVNLSNVTDSSAINKTEKLNSFKYGELIVLGHNGCIRNQQDSLDKKSYSSSRRKSKFELFKNDKPNGVIKSSQINCETSQDVNNLMLHNRTHSVRYTLSRNQSVVVQYKLDENTDMFQIGRSTESAIDFVVLDTIVPNSNKLDTLLPPPVAQSTISRFACRILVDREYPYTARIYAAGFDTSKEIFLGEKATKWKNQKGEIDGVTTNGVLIMHPVNGFNFNDSEVVDNNKEGKKSNEWLEVSVCGSVFSLNESRLSPNFKINITEKSNVLRDGTLIDLCGATLLWRSVASLKQTPSKQYLELNLQYLNRLKPQCPVGFKTLIFPSSMSPSKLAELDNYHLINTESNACSNSNNMDRTPMVYLKCGHVHGQHNWGIKKDNERECPLCRKIGPYVQLLFGLEPSFYCDITINKYTDTKNCEFLLKPYAFIPCGHMASEKTCKYWSKIKMPQGIAQELTSLCPFCSETLCEQQPYVKLIFQEGL